MVITQEIVQQKIHDMKNYIIERMLDHKGRDHLFYKLEALLGWKHTPDFDDDDFEMVVYALMDRVFHKVEQNLGEAVRQHMPANGHIAPDCAAPLAQEEELQIERSPGEPGLFSIVAPMSQQHLGFPPGDHEDYPRLTTLSKALLTTGPIPYYPTSGRNGPTINIKDELEYRAVMSLHYQIDQPSDSMVIWRIIDRVRAWGFIPIEPECGYAYRLADYLVRRMALDEQLRCPPGFIKLYFNLSANEALNYNPWPQIFRFDPSINRVCKNRLRDFLYRRQTNPPVYEGREQRDSTLTE